MLALTCQKAGSLDCPENGVDSDRKAIGFPNLIIEEEIPLDAISRFRQNVDIIDKRDIRDYSELNDFLSTLPNKEPWGKRNLRKRRSEEP